MNFSNRVYKWSKPFSNIRHEWSLIGPRAALSFHVTLNETYGDTAGLEVHYFDAPDYMAEDPPSHIDCSYTGGRCWHEGTSLYATETLWPMIKGYLLYGDHEAIFSILESDLEKRIRNRWERKS